MDCFKWNLVLISKGEHLITEKESLRHSMPARLGVEGRKTSSLQKTGNGACLLPAQMRKWTLNQTF